MPAMARSLLQLPLCSRLPSYPNPFLHSLLHSRSRFVVLRRGAHFLAPAEEIALPSSCGPERYAVACASAAHAGAYPVVTAEDYKYGNKKVISVTSQLYDYILANVREDPILRELREETATMRGSQMQVPALVISDGRRNFFQWGHPTNSVDLTNPVSPEQAQLLSMLVQILGAERCIELGVYTGYSSLAIALALPQTGRLVACERDAKCLEIAKKYYERAGVFHKVDVKHALAVDVLKALIQNGETCSYDFAFVDADKRMYDQYFELLLQLVRVGGVIVFDNVLWHGKVADPLVNDLKTTSIRSFNGKIFYDKRINISMVPIGDGMTICRKVSNC